MYRRVTQGAASGGRGARVCMVPRGGRLGVGCGVRAVITALPTLELVEGSSGGGDGVGYAVARVGRGAAGAGVGAEAGAGAGAGGGCAGTSDAARRVARKASNEV